jgi:hypothetical protein
MQAATLTGDRFFAGLLAGIRLIEPNRLTGSRIALNRAFYKAIHGPEGAFVDKKRLAIDYDPLYGVSPWFERALTRAQRDLLISFPNPTYAAVEIKLSEPQAGKLLELTGYRDEFVALAKAFLSNVPTD